MELLERRLTDLARVPLCQSATDKVNAIFVNLRRKVNKRSQVFIGARNQAFTIAVPTSNEVGSGCFTDCLEPSGLRTRSVQAVR